VIERGSAPRYGDTMPELDIDSLALLAEHRADPLVVCFIELCDRTTRAERISRHEDWSEEERAAYRSDDWEAFSRLRGYTDDEIADFRQYLELAADVSTKYGIDFTCAIAHLVQKQSESS